MRVHSFSGLYIGAHGVYTSEIIHLRRRFGRWQEDGGGDKEEPSKLEFYEYVEAWKVIGDPYVPAGKVNAQFSHFSKRKAIYYDSKYLYLYRN